MKTLKLATRGSPLALLQARLVGDAIRRAHPGVGVDLVEVRTLAEKFPEREAAEIGVGIFTREIDEALLRGEADLAVHSMKDVPSEMHPDLTLAAVPRRESPLDAFISADGRRFEELPAGARIGTGSPRRKAQILYHRGDLLVVPLRGNVASRLRKMGELGLQGIILAHAGLKRLGEERRITQLLPTEILVPAVGQGALAVVARADRAETRAILEALDHGPSRFRALTERAFLRRLRGGCQVPAAALADMPSPDVLSILGLVAAPDGSSCVRGEVTDGPEMAESLGARLAEELLERGGGDMLRALGRA